MSLNFDNIRDTYDKLASSASDSCDIYAREYSELMEEKGISENKWLEDRVVMQMAQETMAQELEAEVPQTLEEWKQRLRTFISRQISSYLRGESSDIARKGFLLQAIQAAKMLNNQFDKEEFEQISRLTIEELQEEFVDLIIAYTVDTVLPIIQEQCNSVMPETEQQTFVCENAGALALAGYMENEEMQKMPEVAGYSAELVSRCFTWEKTEKVLSIISFALFLIACWMVFFALIEVLEVAVGSPLLTIFMILEGQSVAEVGALVAAFFEPALGMLIGMLKIALGSSVLATCIEGVRSIVDNNINNSEQDNSNYVKDIAIKSDVFA